MHIGSAYVPHLRKISGQYTTGIVRVLQLNIRENGDIYNLNYAFSDGT